MKDINLKEIKLRLLEEVTKGKYQLIFHDYGGNNVPYTEQYFDSKYDAIDFAQVNAWQEEVETYEDGEYKYEDIERFYNPQSKKSEYGFHVEEV